VSPRGKLIQGDGLLAAALLLLGGLYAAACVSWSLPPSEDAAILMRYAHHLAQGHGVVWNIGEKPVDGATGFLFMALIAGIARLGASVEGAARGVGLVSHFLTILAVYVAIRKLHGLGRWAAAVSAAYLAVGPGLRYVAAYFGTPFFALFVCLAWTLAHVLAREEATNAKSLLFALTGLLMGLTRPEGVFLAGFMLLAVLWSRRPQGSGRIIVWFVGVFAVLGGAYFVWRWSYFGYPLPNPYYKKGGGSLHWDSLVNAAKTILWSCLPFAFAYVAAFRSAKATRQAVFSLIPLAGYTLLWVLLSGETNYYGRFQCAALPMVLIAWPALLEGIGSACRLPRLGDLGRRDRAALLAVAGCILAAVLFYQHRISRAGTAFRDGLYDAAQILREFRDKGYTLVTTEAGLLPFYSEWRTVDAWGLNDPWIAHHGGITEDYLRSQNPEVIMFHAYFSPIATWGRHDEWEQMTQTLRDFAEKGNYWRVASFGESPFDTHYYYVRKDFADAREIAGQIRGMAYSWACSGRTCVNYADLRPGGGT